MSALAWTVVALPAAGAVGLALMRQRAAAGWVGVGVAAVTLVLATALHWRTGEGALLRVDALAAHFAVLVALAGGLCAWFRRAMPGVGHGLAALAGLELAVLAGVAPLAWGGLAGAVLALVLAGAGGLEARWRALRMVVPALALALAALLLADAVPGGASLGWILVLAGLAPVAGLAPLHGWMGAAGRAGSALLPALGAVALLILARAQAGVLADPAAVVPGPPLVALGLASLGWAALGLWRDGMRPGGREAGRDAMLFQAGLAAVAFGLGAPGAVAAGLLLLSAAVPLGPVAAWGGRGRAGALAALALLPPFATFGAGVALLSEAAEANPWLALALATLVATGAAGLARAALAAWGASGPRDPRAEIAAALILALVVAAGVVPGTARWFAQLAEAL